MRTSKLLISSLLAAAAMSVPAFAETTSGTLLPNFYATGESGTLTSNIEQFGGGKFGTNWNRAIGGTSINADAVAQNLASSTTLATQGWHWGIAQKEQTADSADVSVGGTVDAPTFTFKNRPSYSGEFVAATVDLGTLLGGNAAAMKTELSISFDVSAVANLKASSFSIWSWDGDTATEVYKDSSAFTTTSRSVSVNTNPLLLGSGKLLVVWNASGGPGGTAVTISNLTSSYTASTFSTLYWRGNAEGETWSSSSTQWNTDSSATSGNASSAGGYDDVIFDSSATVAIDPAGVAVDTLTISAGTVSFSGGAVAVKSGLALSDGTTLSLNGTSVNTGSGTTTIGTNAQLTVSGDGALNTTITSMDAGSSLTLAGTGDKSEITLSGWKSISGNLTIGNATVNVFAQKDTFNWSNTTTDQLIVLNEGGTLNFGDKRQSLNSRVKFTLNGGTITGSGDADGAMDFYNENTIKVTADSILEASVRLRTDGGSGDLTFDVDEGKTLTFTGVINKTAETNTRKIIKSGAGKMILSGDNSNYSNGGFSIQAGTLIAANASAFGTGTVTAAGSDGVNEVTLRIDQDSSGNALTITNEISVSSGKTLILESSNMGNELSGMISGAGALKKAGAGTLRLSGANTYTGGTVIEAGTLVAVSESALSTEAVTVTGDATLLMNPTVSTFRNNVSVADGKTLSLQAHGTDFTGTLSGNGNVSVKTFYSAMLGTADMLTLSGDNTDFAGTLSVGGLASINAKHENALGSGTLKITMQTFPIGVHTGTVNAAVAGVKLNDVSISLKDAATAVLTADESCSFTVAEGATLYLDISKLTEKVLTGEKVALTIAAGNAIDSFFSTVEVGKYVDDAWLISSEWKYLAHSWNASAGTLSITAIPEPSMFGLLAGLGALALAGTRRRRQKKA